MNENKTVNSCVLPNLSLIIIVPLIRHRIISSASACGFQCKGREYVSGLHEVMACPVNLQIKTLVNALTDFTC